MRKYTTEMIDWIRREYPRRTGDVTAQMFERKFGIPMTKKKLQQINCQYGLGLRARKESGNRLEPGIVSFIRDNYLLYPRKALLGEIEKRFGRRISETSLAQCRARLGLGRRPPGGQFRAGNVPHNKGRKMAPETYAKCQRTMFRRDGGQVRRPLLTMYTVRHRKKQGGRTELYIRIPDAARPSGGKWVSYSRWVWEQAHGPIPPGGVVVHVDGDQRNCAPDNLRLIDRRVLACLNHSGTPDPVGGDRHTNHLRITLAAMTLAAGERARKKR